MAESMTGSHGTWWGEFGVATGRRWRIGPLDLWIHRATHEWRVSFQRGDDPLEDTLRPGEPTDEAPPDSAETLRFGFREVLGKVELRPRLADRSVVVRPANPFYLTGGEEATLYLSSPLWIEVRVGVPWQALCEIPVFQPSDTWSGVRPTAGELCYALVTSARLHLSNLPARPQRAFSALRVRNSTESRIHVERIKVPVPNLSLFATSSGQLWTETVTLELATERERSEVRFDAGPSILAADARRIGDPRQSDRKGFLRGAFDELFALKDRDYERRAE